MTDLLAAGEDEYIEPPAYTWRRTLQEMVGNYTPDSLPKRGEYVTFKLDDCELSELHIEIYVRPPHSSVTSRVNFPLINISLAGSVVDKLWLRRHRAYEHVPEAGQPCGYLYNKGAFRSLIRYLDRELPARGYTGIFLEYVENTQLAAVAERYGFVQTGDPESLCFVRPLAA
jgi:hypothetical protein